MKNAQGLLKGKRDRGETMTPLKPADIFVIQAAIENYKRKHPRQAAPSAEVALAWQIERRRKRTKARVQPKSAGAGLFLRLLENIRFLFKPLSSS